MITAAIIDDEKNIREGLKTIINDYCPDIEILGEAFSVETGLYIIKRYKPEIVFLDIRLPDGTGFDILQKLDKINSKIIFVTSYSDFALKAIKFSAIDYILKPIIPDELIKAIKKASNFIEQENKYIELNSFYEQNAKKTPDKIVLKTQKNAFYIPVKNIIFCKADVNYTCFSIKNQKPITVAKTLKFYQEILEEHNFKRVHQSFLINPIHIKAFEDHKLLMSNGKKVDVARRKLHFVKNLLAG